MAAKPEVDAHRIVRYVESDMSAEGFRISAKAKSDCHVMIRGKVSADHLVQKYAADCCSPQRTP